MRCNEVRKLTSEYIDYELTEASRQAYEAHVSDCSGCSEHLDRMRGLVAGLRQIGAPSAPDDLFDQTMMAIDRAAQPELSIMARRPFRLQPQFHGSLMRLVDGLAFNYEFKLISFSFGLVFSFFLFSGILASMRPLMTITEFVPQSRTAQADSIEFVTPPSTDSLPRVSMSGPLARDVAVINLDDLQDGLVVVAEITPDGRGSIVQVLSPDSNGYTVGEIALALNRPRTFVPAINRSGRPISSRVVMFFDRVEVVG